MQSVVVYGRLLARALAGLNNNQVSSKSFRLISAASGVAKDLGSPAAIHRRNVHGDDACFIASNKAADVLGVADGVGGWRRYGIDPSLFSSSLMKTCERLVELGEFTPQFPVEIIATSYSELLESKSPILGSSTVCIAVLDRLNRTIYTANLGDSGYLIVRKGEVVHRSEEQQHYFNTPFQLALPPRDKKVSFSVTESSSFNVEEGDVIVMASDGLFDNMSEELICRELSKLRDRCYESIQQIARNLVEKARQLAHDPDYISPFARHARANGINIKGGKPDDITVLLAMVSLHD